MNIHNKLPSIIVKGNVYLIDLDRRMLIGINNKKIIKMDEYAYEYFKALTKRITN